MSQLIYLQGIEGWVGHSRGSGEAKSSPCQDTNPQIIQPVAKTLS